MKSYLLLRDNQQSGPYTIQELQQKGLYSLDLLWVEGESTAWQYPNEIQELNGLIKAKKTVVKKKPSITSSSTTLATHYQPVTQTTAVSSATAINDSPNNNVRDYYPYEDVAKELYAEIRYSRPKRRLSLNGNVMGLFLILIGAAMAAFIVKNIVGTFGNEPSAPVSQAREITAEKMSSESSSAAFKPTVAEAAMTGAPVQAIPIVPAPERAPVQQSQTDQTNTAATNDVQQPVATTIDKPKAATKQSTTEIMKADDVAVNTAPAKSEADTKVEVKQDPPKEKKVVKDVRSMVHLSANQYKVGMLGGISDLQLQVTNDSPNQIDNATVEVEYLKPNGGVVKTETLQVHGIQPGRSKTVPVPGSSRGVKAVYRVVDASSHES
jgi:hypothetical protein